MTYLLPLVIIAGVFGYLFYIKKSGKLGQYQQNYLEADEDVKQNFEKHFSELKEDPETFKPIKDIIGSDFISLINCKQPKNMLDALKDTAKTMATTIVSENTNIHTLVLTEDKLHYIEYNFRTKKAEEHWEFLRSKIKDLTLGEGKLTDNLKQSMSFDLKGGGQSGDSTNNSKMKKLVFHSNDKNYEFFLYDTCAFGKGFVPEKPIGGLALNQSKEDIVKSMLLPVKIGELFFNEIIKS
ncbi:hypothetical protein [Olleya sp. HaHaR_3_96]|uniref:hypothetical protein n=1 Tax=Olleya sp. HaHaR_3_96 TaxID=2745560 RepID=UPI001C50144E|nr:hypothetical protein [Olleya sp. HaHaR_3_96]QXP59001.1 hypothetical protein H0I26_13895 [Olleya sp. HaHaR_3_96]